MATVNRGELLKKARAGRLVLVSSYHFDDTMGEDRHKGEPIPVAMDPGDWKDRKPGVCYLHEHDFKSSSGFASFSEDSDSGIICLHVHSNCTYDLKEIDAAGKVVIPRAPRKTEYKPGADDVISNVDDTQIVAFLEAWHENGRASFKRSYPNSYEIGSYDAPHGQAKSAKDRKKYIALDEGTSGHFLVEKSTGKVFDIAGYGRPNHYIGTIGELTEKYRAATLTQRPIMS